jgi:CO/xanthine dehydrogenase FAD-binding subunit
VHSISYDRARDIAHALELGGQPGAKFIGGGTNLLDLYKSGIERPTRLVDVGRLALDAIEELPDGGLRLGATASNTAAANHPLVRQRYRLLSEALLNGASSQLRNMATVAATCCSAPAAITLATRRSARATSARRAPAARPWMATTASTPSSARASTALPPTRPT